MKPREMLLGSLALIPALLILSQLFLLFSDSVSGYGFLDKLSLVSNQYSVIIGVLVLAVAHLAHGHSDRISGLARKIALVIAGLNVLGFVIGIGNGPYGQPGFFGYLAYFATSVAATLPAVVAIYIILRTEKGDTKNEAVEGL